MTKHDADSGRADLSPRTNSVWLPAGAKHTVLIDAAAYPSFFSEGGPAVVEVGFDPAGDVVARVDGETLGEFDGESSAQLSPSLRQLESRGLVALAHGSFTTVDGAPAVTVYADPLGAPPAPTGTESAESTHPDTDPIPSTEPFAADREAEAAALAADAVMTSGGGTTTARRFPRNRNLQAVAILASALAIGFVGVVGYYYGAHEHDGEMTAFMNSADDSTAGTRTTLRSSAPATATGSTETTKASQPVSAPPPPASQTQDTGTSPGSDQHTGGGDWAPSTPQPPAAHVPAPNQAPAPAPPAPAAPDPGPHQAPAPGPAPYHPEGGTDTGVDSGVGRAGGASDDLPPPQPIFELQW